MTEQDYSKAAELLSVDPAIIKAIAKVESNGSGFLKDGRMKILFEGHVFWRELIKWGAKPVLIKGHENILYEKWTKKHYVGGAGEWDRWSEAVKLCKDLKLPTAAALNSASYGMFQVMGFNHRACGYASAHEMIADYNTGQAAQLRGVIKLIKANGWDKYLNPVDVNGFVEKYNGKGYRENDYHTKFALALKENGFTDFKLTA